MKSLETLPVLGHFRTWEDDDLDFEEQEVTAEISVLGGLITRPATTLDHAAPITKALDLLIEERIPAIAVIDGNQLCGVITRTDVLRVLRDQPDARVADAMSGFVLTMPAESSVESAAALMAIEEVGQIVVTRRGDLVGLVSALDIARHVARRAGYLDR